MREPTRREWCALVAASAAGALFSSCASAFDGSVTPESGRALLTFAAFPALATPGGGVTVDVRGGFPIVAVRTGAAAAIALSATCTHAGCVLRFASAPQNLHCDCHGADFALDGAVLRGPTDVPLPTYAATVGADAITVDLT